MSLHTIAQQLVATGKGILAADESSGTIKKRFASINTESAPENNRLYRQMLFTAPGVEKYISGVILFDETIRQQAEDGRSLPLVLSERGIIPGIKVDLGTELFPGSEIEKFTKGLEGLDERLKEYVNFGAKFAKWRAVFIISESTPSEMCIDRNAGDLAEYAFICQQNSLVPIVEPEVLMDGDHTIEKCFEVTKKVLQAVFAKLKDRGIDLSGILLKPNMVLPGEKIAKAAPEQIAEFTLKCLSEAVPAGVPGIVFLSGGQTEDEACANLNAMNATGDKYPWELSFSFGRALQNSALKTWAGKPENVESAQRVFLERCRKAGEARRNK
ncbi:MAG: fructose-bisphosphate aldolase class I [Candidatus Magasanikbacteria bacterium]|nr:fructose-bisphosphate aldolase class I [Candidatus Magasanikbacteria bacterium]